MFLAYFFNLFIYLESHNTTQHNTEFMNLRLAFRQMSSSFRSNFSKDCIQDYFHFDLNYLSNEFNLNLFGSDRVSKNLRSGSF